jgi:PAS domain S-box-containing protein
MNDILQPLLYVLAGITAYAAVLHALIGARRPVDPVHLWFAFMCVALIAYILAKAYAYQAASAGELIAGRRWEVNFSLLFFIVFPWFVRAYTRVPGRLIPALLGLFLMVVLVANVLLPFGVNYPYFPEFTHLLLPWGERVADLRVRHRGAWHIAGWIGFLLAFAYALYAAWRQYQRGERHAARTLFLALAFFLAFTLFNQLVNSGVVNFPHTAEFGFLALVVIMSLGITGALHGTERRMQAILDHVPALVYLKDPLGRYLLVNRPFAALFVRGNPELLRGKTDANLFPTAQAAALRANDLRVLETGEADEREEVVDVAGEARVFISLKFPLQRPDGSPYAVCGVSRDVTDARRAKGDIETLRHQLGHADRVARLNAISSTLAHELRQPLAAILNNAEAGLRLLGRDPPDLDEVREILGDIVRDDGRAAAVIQGMREMLSQKRGTQQTFSLRTVVQEILDLLQGEFALHRVSCERALKCECTVKADRVQVGQVVLNLLMNALEAVANLPSGHGRVEVSVFDEARDGAHVQVRDNGLGLPQGESDRIFEPFFSSKPQGMGMGLTLSGSIIEAHGGRIWAVDNDGAGATVEFCLPLASAGREV